MGLTCHALLRHDLCPGCFGKLMKFQNDYACLTWYTTCLKPLVSCLQATLCLASTHLLHTHLALADMHCVHCHYYYAGVGEATFG